jgi:hypothetical protein
VDHPNHPKELLENPPKKGAVTDFQIQRAAGIINNLLNAKDMLEKLVS